MAVFLYRCPNNGLLWQAWIEAADPESARVSERAISTGCLKNQLVNSVTDKIISSDSAGD
jgi:hypothetical protein